MAEQRSRENPDPQEADGLVPLWFVGFCAAVLLFGAFWLVTNTPDTVAWAGDRRSPAMKVAPAEQSGETLYASRCTTCHQSHGNGIAGAFPPLVASSWVVQDPETPIRILLLGLQGEIEVKGAKYNGVMPAFGDWSDLEIAKVLTYIRSSWGNDAPAIEPSQVAAIREGLGSRTSPWKGGAELEAARDEAPASAGTKPPGEDS